MPERPLVVALQRRRLEVHEAVLLGEVAASLLINDSPFLEIYFVRHQHPRQAVLPPFPDPLDPLRAGRERILLRHVIHDEQKAGLVVLRRVLLDLVEDLRGASYSLKLEKETTHVIVRWTRVVLKK